MTPSLETNDPTSPARRENGETDMFPRTRLHLAAVAAAALATACGDVTVEAGTWPWPHWPDGPAFVVTRDLFETVPVAGQSAVLLEAVNGTVLVSGRPGATSVTVTAELRAGSDVSWLDAQEGLGQMGVLLTERPDAILVQTRQPAGFDGRQYLVNYTVTVPAHLVVDVSQVNGRVTLLDLEDLLVDLTNGNVRLSGAVAAANVVVRSGNVSGTVSLRRGGEIVASTNTGNIEIRIPAATSSELTALVELGAITWDGLVLRDAVQTSRSLTGTLGDGAGRIELETRTGNIHLTGFEE